MGTFVNTFIEFTPCSVSALLRRMLQKAWILALIMMTPLQQLIVRKERQRKIHTAYHLSSQISLVRNNHKYILYTLSLIPVSMHIYFSDYTIIYVTIDLRKATFHTHNSKTHFSASNNSCTHQLTIQAGIGTKSCSGCFFCGLFLRLVIRPQVLGWSLNGSISP